MLTLQYLKKYGLENLSKNFPIEIKEHSDLPLVILNYNKFSHSSPLINECKQLVIDPDDMKIVGRSFEHFRKKELKFLLDNTDTLKIQTKYKGSLIQLFYYNNRWQTITKSSFSSYPVYENGPTWETLVSNLLPNGTHILDKNHSYIFQLVNHTQLFLLTSFNIDSGLELEDSFLDNLALNLGVNRPDTWDGEWDGEFVAKVFDKCENKYIRMKISREDYLKVLNSI